MDLLTIWVYVAERNMPAGDKLLAKLEVSVETLAAHPALGEAIDHVVPGLRRFSMDNYVLIYRRIENGVRLPRVFHGARDFANTIDEIADDGR